MKRLSKIIFYTISSCFLVFALGFSACKEESNGENPENPDEPMDIFGTVTVSGPVQNDLISEASGIVNSQSNDSYIWVHNDGGAEPENRLFLMDKNGQDKGMVWLKDLDNIDWEDIALGPGPEQGKTYLYIGQIGDNRAQFDTRNIFRIEEPTIAGGTLTTDTITNIETITYRYPDGPRDAETLIVDPLTKDIYIISKRESPVINIYVMKYPQSVTDTIVLEKTGTLPFTQATGGDISKDGTEILIKNYTNVFYWKREPNESITEALSKDPTNITYQIEPQGEAIAFASDNSGFFTLSEEASDIETILYFYPRIE